MMKTSLALSAMLLATTVQAETVVWEQTTNIDRGNLSGVYTFRLYQDEPCRIQYDDLTDEQQSMLNHAVIVEGAGSQDPDNGEFSDDEDNAVEACWIKSGAEIRVVTEGRDMKFNHFTMQYTEYTETDL